MKADTDGGLAWVGDEVIFPTPKNPVDDPNDDWDVIDNDRDGLTDVVELNSITE